MADRQPGSYDKWQRFFADLANGMLPYLQLYAKRSQRGSGLGGFKGSHRRFQVPVPNYNSQIGQGSKGVKMIAPTQQSVEMAKAMIKHQDDVISDIPSTKSKPVRSKVQKRGRPAGGKTTKTAAASKKKPGPKKGAKSKQNSVALPKDVFGLR